MLKSFFRLPNLCLWLPAGLWLLVLNQAPVIGADTVKSQSSAATKPVVAPISNHTGQSPKQVYVAKCSFCHDPKPATARPDLKAWVSLLYTSGCPDVAIKLDETQRRAIKTHFENEFKTR